MGMNPIFNPVAPFIQPINRICNSKKLIRIMTKCRSVVVAGKLAGVTAGKRVGRQSNG
ncbi:hypothetical protein HanRHA438_Chr05g0202811 [Helianthus annuus]|nr:hypothetical protein HanRHA438_Chr05g0202811 [Helianthus annuus]